MSSNIHERHDNLHERHDGHAFASAKESFKEAGHNLKEAGQILTKETRDRVDQAVVDVKKHSTEVKTAVNNYIIANPMKSMGWSLLAGTFLGFLLRK